MQHKQSNDQASIGVDLSSFSVRDIINDTIEERISDINQSRIQNATPSDSDGY